MKISIKYIKYTLTCLVATLSISAQAQQENTLHFMSSVPQVMNTNPAFVPNWNYTFSLPAVSGISLSYNNSGFAYKDLITRRVEDDSLEYNLPKLGNALRERNFINKSLQTELFGLGFRAGKLYFTLNASLKSFNDFSYSRGFLAFFAEGNAQYIGQDVSVSPVFNSITYGEGSIGVAYQINPQLTVGTRLKYLTGIANVHTQRSTFNLYTDEQNYAITLTGDAVINTSGLRSFTDDEYDSSFDPSEMLANRGYGIDLGATYKIDEKLTVGLSILDLGSITWKHEAQRHTLGDGSSFSFSGIDLNNRGDDEEDSEGINLMDSIKNMFTAQNIASYKTALPTRFYLSANYQLFKNTQVGALFFGQNVYGRFRGAFSTSVVQNVHRNLSASVSYTTTGFSNHVGGGLVFRLATMQFHIISDNMITAALVPNNVKSLNARVGMNFTVGGK